jgi:hypothetical protein
MTDNLSERLNLAVSESLILRIDNWRRQHPRIPTRAEATRLLIEQALAADKTATKQPEPLKR